MVLERMELKNSEERCEAEWVMEESFARTLRASLFLGVFVLESLDPIGLSIAFSDFSAFVGDLLRENFKLGTEDFPRRVSMFSLFSRSFAEYVG